VSVFVAVQECCGVKVRVISEDYSRCRVCGTWHKRRLTDRLPLHPVVEATAEILPLLLEGESAEIIKPSPRSSPRSPDDPHCLTCRTPYLLTTKKKVRWWCGTCRYSIRFHYVKPVRKGKPTKSQNPSNPWCIDCKLPMSSGGARRWICRRCKSEKRKPYGCRRQIVAVRNDIQQRREQILALGEQGLTIRAISRLVKSNEKTIKAILPAGYQPGLCKCGQSANHTGTCSARWATRIQNIIAKHSNGDELVRSFQVRITERLPVSLPAEVRGDVAQAMLVDLFFRFDEILKDTPNYIRRYYAEQPTKFGHVYIDDPDVRDRLAG